MSYTNCPYCKKRFKSLGIMRHRTACREKKEKEERQEKNAEDGIPPNNKLLGILPTIL